MVFSGEDLEFRLFDLRQNKKKKEKYSFKDVLGHVFLSRIRTYTRCFKSPFRL